MVLNIFVVNVKIYGEYQSEILLMLLGPFGFSLFLLKTENWKLKTL